MKITRYFQSCVIVEENNIRLLIDAGEDMVAEIEKFGQIDAVLFTHEHDDHFSAELAEKYAQIGTPIYANQSTAAKLSRQPILLESGQELDVKGLKVKPIDLPHCPLFNGSAGPQNTGLLINNKFFHCGDGVEIQGLTVEVAGIPIVGPDVSFKDSIACAKNLGAKTIVPLHYDYLGAKPDVFSYYVEKIIGAKTAIIETGSTVEV